MQQETKSVIDCRIELRFKNHVATTKYIHEMIELQCSCSLQCYKLKFWISNHNKEFNRYWKWNFLALSKKILQNNKCKICVNVLKLNRTKHLQTISKLKQQNLSLLYY